MISNVKTGRVAGFAVAPLALALVGCVGNVTSDAEATGSTASALTAVPVNGPAGTVVAVGPIRVGTSANCLFAYGTNDLGEIAQYACLGSADQSFQLQSSGDGSSYFIVSANSGKCINVDGGSVAAYATIIQYDCQGSSNERFVPSLNSDGTYQLAAMNSGMCLNVPDLGSVVQLDQVPCNGSANQKFTLPVSCTKVVTSSLNEVNPYGASIALTYSLVGGGGGASQGGGGGGGGSSAVLNGSAGTTLVGFGAGGAGNSTATGSTGVSGHNGTTASGSFSLAATDKLSVFVGGGGAAGNEGQGGGGGSGFFGGGGGGNWAAGGEGGGGTGTAGGGGGGGGGSAGGSEFGGNSGTGFGGANGANAGVAGDNVQAAGGGGFGSGGGGAAMAYPNSFGSGGSNGGNGGASVTGGAGLGASSFVVTGSTLPASAGAGGGVVDYETVAGGNAGLVILTYSTPTGVCSL